MHMTDTTARWYGGLIAIVSGIYAVAMATWGSGMGTADWFMLALGIVVLGHGIALFGRFSRSLDDASGVLMIVYSVIMLVAQVWLGPMGGSGFVDGGMDGGMTSGMGDTAMQSTMGWSTLAWDPGMVAIAVLMLGSGVIMTVIDGREF